MYLNPYGVPAIFTTLMFLILTILVLRNNPNRRANQIATVLFVGFLIWSFAEILEKFLGEGEEDLAAFAERFYGVGVLLVPSGLVHFSLVFPRVRRVPKAVYAGLYGSYAVMLGLMFLTDLFVQGVKFGDTGWEAVYGDFVALYFGYALVVALGSVVVFISTLRESTMIIEKKQVSLILLGLLATIALLVGTFVVPTLVLGSVPFFFIPTTTSLLIFSLFIFYSIRKYKMFVIEAVIEDGGAGVEDSTLPVELGFTHLIEEDGLDESYAAFRNKVSNVPGLCLTTTHPDKIRERRGLGRTPIVWLSESAPTETHLTINPWRLDFELSYTIKNFMEENTETVIMIDDLEYLASVNGFEKMVGFVKSLNDTASINNSTVIAPVNPSAFDPEEFHSLASAFDKRLKAEDGRKGAVDEIHAGNSYLVDTTRMREQMNILKAYIKENPTLCITKTYPDKFVKIYDLSGVKIYWLTESQHGEEKFISPTRLDFELAEVVGEFMKGAEQRTVILDGLEQLIQVNGFKRTLDYIKNVEDRISAKKGVLFVSVEWESLKDNEKAILEKKFDYISA